MVLVLVPWSGVHWLGSFDEHRNQYQAHSAFLHADALQRHNACRAISDILEGAQVGKNVDWLLSSCQVYFLTGSCCLLGTSGRTSAGVGKKCMYRLGEASACASAQ